MARIATSGSFKPGYVQSPEHKAKIKAARERHLAGEMPFYKRPDFLEKQRKPCPARGNTGEKNGRYRPVGSKFAKGQNGYVFIKIANPSVWVHEHRLVAAANLGRPLEKGEHVHHLNGDKHDNRPENLVVMTSAQHKAVRQHGHPRCPTCGYKHPAH